MSKLNHGSYGLMPVAVSDEYVRWQTLCHNEPERFHRDLVPKETARTASTVACHFNVEEKQVEFSANATEAFRLILSSLSSRTDRIVVTDLTYPSVIQAVSEWQTAAAGRTLQVVPVEGHLIDGAADRIVSSIAGAATESTLVVVDQIPSSVPLEMPVLKLIDSLEPEVQIAVDGAHAAGIVEHPVPDGVIWFTSFHKWLYGPPTSGAVVWPACWQREPKPMATRLGTRDHSAVFSLSSAIDFPHRELGITWPQLQATNSKTLAAGLARLQDRVGGSVVHDTRFPMGLLHTEIPVGGRDASEHMRWFREHGVEVAVFENGDAITLRVSGQAYVSSEDFDRLGVLLERLG
ncbi:MAG: aminotransferase class V-fold PLP-dependent enzyme [Ilumatobacter sp.]|nr:aminotransferase class V-fold PLP-dependent enzyme [Ilumatobacter sp.]